MDLGFRTLGAWGIFNAYSKQGGTADSQWNRIPIGMLMPPRFIAGLGAELDYPNAFGLMALFNVVKRCI